jgi:predicted aspartyl protease
MRSTTGCLACLIICLSAQSMRAQTPDAFQSMYKANQVFALRDAVERSNAPLFYRAAVEASSNDLKTAEKDLHALIGASPHSAEAYEAHDLLANMYFRNGRYRGLFREITAALLEKPDGADAQNMLPIATALGDLPQQILIQRKPTKLRIEPGTKDLPVEINGQKADYFFDTGSGISVLGQSEAKRFGLVPKAVNGKMGEASGTDITDLQIVMVKDVVIGGLHLKNVPFLVLSDTGEPWIHIPQNKRGIIGLPILLAMQTVRWTPSGSFEFGFPSRNLDLPGSNMLFHNSNPVILVMVEGKQLDFTLDTGAVDTDLNPPFAKALPELMKTGKVETRSIEGLGGSNDYNSVLLPSVTFEFGGQSPTLKPAHVFTEHGNGTWAAGNLGMDLLDQGNGFTLDFQAMTLRLN